MAATNRSAAARRTAPAAARRTPRTKLAAVPAPDPVDILADFGTEEKPPVPIKLGAVLADVRRGYSGDEVIEFHQLIANQKFGEMLDLITTKGAEVWEFIGNQNPELASKILNKLINLSGLHEGNLLAPLPGFALNPAGAQPSPESSATTE